MNFTQFFRKLMFADAKRLVILGRKKILQAEDMPALPDHLNPRRLPFPETALDVASGKRFIRSLFVQAKKLVIPAYLCNLGFVGLNLTKPILVNSFIHRISELGEGKDPTVALLLAVSLGLVSFLGSLLMQHYFLRSLYAVQVYTNAINRLIYKHALMLTQKSRGETALGDVVNHMGSDTDAAADLPLTFGEIVISLVTLLGATALLFHYLGETALLSIALLSLTLPLTKRVAKSFSSLDEELMKHRDERVTLMSQVLNGIRVVKYFSWEKSIFQEVGNIRSKELRARKNLARAESLATLSYVAISTLVLFASFWWHIQRGFSLSPELVFTCVAIFALLEDPLSHLSELVSRSAAGIVAADRICAFLQRERLNTVSPKESGENILPGIEVQNLSLQYPKAEKPALKEWNLQILPGESVAVIGAVGAGKSTFLHALLRELPLSQGSISFLDKNRKTVVPRIAYVPQEAFIVNGSLKENIFFGENEDKELLQKALHASCLAADLEQLPAGLFTEIGEKGVNLSGGQKQRVSLARSVVQQPNLVLLDDPLSAVDARTEELLAERLLFGVWKSITRVVVTHRLAFLPKFDKIVFIDDGEIKGVGTFSELFANSEAFRGLCSNSEQTDHGSSLMAPESAAATAPPAKEASSVMRVTEDEDRAIGAVKNGVYRDYILALGGAPKNRIFVLPLLVLTAVAAAGAPMVQKAWLALSANLQTGKTPNAGTLLHALASNHQHSVLVYGGLGFLGLLCILTNRLFWMERGMAAGRNMHNNMLRSVLRAPLRFFDSTPMGRVLQRFSRDVEAVDIQLQWSFETTVRCLVNISMALFLILTVLPLMALVIVPVLWLYYRLQRDYRMPAREAKRLDSISRSPRFAHFKETLQGLVVIRAFGKTDLFLETFFQRLEHSQRMFHGHYMLNRWFSSRIPLLGGTIASATGVGVVLYAQRGWLSPGVAGLVVVYALSLWEYLNWAVRIFAEVEAKMTSVERLKYYASLESEKEIFQEPLPDLSPAWPENGEVVFDRVQARYASHLPPVLKGISFRIPAGARVGVIGRTGSGKSTLLQTLFRCMELELGEIRIDGKNIASIPLERLRKSLAIIPQDPTLFMGTLRSNLDRYEEYGDEDLWNALNKARLGDFVRALPLGLASPVSENGANFSQGQRQLLCLARALLLNAKIIVMDEATASVDVKTDALVQEVIRESCKGVTMLIIAHRLGTVADCDLVLEVREGKLHRTLDLKKQAELIPTC